MKTIVKWYKWIILAVIFQFCMLFYINNIFLNAEHTVSTKRAEIDKKPMTGEFKVPKDVNDLSVSYNARFGAYLEDGVLHIISASDSSDKKVAGINEDKITFFRWLPDRDIVIFSSDTKNGNSGNIKVSTYEADSETTRDYPDIANLPSNSKVVDIELSPFTNVVYAQIKTSDTRTKIIRFNVMGQFSNIINLQADAIIKECSYVDKFVYQNSGEAVYIYNGINRVRNKIPIDAENIKLLGIDLNDNLYIGILDNFGKVTQIYHQKIDENKPVNSWIKIVLKESCSHESIVISGNGNIYVNSVNDNKIANISNNLKASYRGDFIEVLDGAVVSKSEDKVFITSLKEY